MRQCLNSPHLLANHGMCAIANHGMCAIANALLSYILVTVEVRVSR
jgi:hypothetical protein